MIPRKLTIENPSGTEISCGSSASDGLLERDAKSGALLTINEADPCAQHDGIERGGTAYVTRVAMLLMQDMVLETIDHPNAEPWIFEG